MSDHTLHASPSPDGHEHVVVAYTVKELLQRMDVKMDGILATINVRHDKHESRLDALEDVPIIHNGELRMTTVEKRGINNEARLNALEQWQNTSSSVHIYKGKQAVALLATAGVIGTFAGVAVSLINLL